jgi:hypothetical protein
MKAHSVFRKGIWVLLAVFVVIALHGIIFYYVTSHLVLSSGLIAGVIILVAIKLIVIKRWRLPGSVHALFRRHTRD